MLLSVIVPVYNGERYLTNCIDSIAKAIEGINAEVIVINDGSTDGTGFVCHDLAEEYDFLKVLNLRDEGVSVARNKGFKQSSGEYVTFVDADDTVKPDMFAKLLDVAKSTNADITGCGFEIIHKLGECPEGEPVPNRFVEYSPQDFIFDQMLGRNNTRCWSKLYKRSIAQGIEFLPNLTIGEDIIYSATAAKKSSKIVEISNYCGYNYYINSEGAMNRKFRPSYMDQIKCWEFLEEIIKTYEDYDSRGKVMLYAKMMMSCLLVASKIAMLSAKERTQFHDEIGKCKETLRMALSLCPEAFDTLDKGYKIKVTMFMKTPSLYLNLYHNWKG